MVRTTPARGNLYRDCTSYAYGASPRSTCARVRAHAHRNLPVPSGTPDRPSRTVLRVCPHDVTHFPQGCLRYDYLMRCHPGSLCHPCEVVSVVQSRQPAERAGARGPARPASVRGCRARRACHSRPGHGRKRVGSGVRASARRHATVPRRHAAPPASVPACAVHALPRVWRRARLASAGTRPAPRHCARIGGIVRASAFGVRGRQVGRGQRARIAKSLPFAPVESGRLA